MTWVRPRLVAYGCLAWAAPVALAVRVRRERVAAAGASEGWVVEGSAGVGRLERRSRPRPLGRPRCAPAASEAAVRRLLARGRPKRRHALQPEDV